MQKIVNGLLKELALTDFCTNKLSDRLGLIEFNDFTASEKSAKDLEGNEMKYWIYGVKCMNYFNNKQITVNIDYNTQNKVILEEIKRKVANNPLEKVFIDFNDVVVGHYVASMGNISLLTQTYKASEVKIMDRKEIEKALHVMKNGSKTEEANQGQQGSQPPHPNK